MQRASHGLSTRRSKKVAKRSLGGLGATESCSLSRRASERRTAVTFSSFIREPIRSKPKPFSAQFKHALNTLVLALAERKAFDTHNAWSRLASVAAAPRSLRTIWFLSSS